MSWWTCTQVQRLAVTALISWFGVVGPAALSAQNSRSESQVTLKEVKLGKGFVLMVNPSANRIVTGGFLAYALPFKRAQIMRDRPSGQFIFLFCAYSCLPDPGGYWAWVQLPVQLADMNHVRIVTIFDSLANQTNVSVRQNGDQSVILTLTFATGQGWSDWRNKLTRAGFGILLDPPIAATRTCDAPLDVK